MRRRELRAGGATHGCIHAAVHVIAPLSGFLVTLDAEAAAAAARGCWFAAERMMRASLASLLALQKLLPWPLLLSAGTDA